MGKEVHTNRAPMAIGPYSQAYQVGSFLFTSGQIPLTPAGEIINGNIIEQTHQAFNNLRAVLEGGGACLNDVVKVTVFIPTLMSLRRLMRFMLLILETIVLHVHVLKFHGYQEMWQ